MIIAELFLMLVLILVAAEVFTNALEHLGEKIGLSEGVTGSIFASVGTALPETLVPLIAILGGTTNVAMNHEIGVGAILGAPLMLSTLSISLLCLAVRKKRTLHGHFHPERTGLKRDLSFFIFAFLIATLALFVPHHQWYLRVMLSMLMVTTYIVYLYQTFQASKALVAAGHGTQAEEPMILSRLGLPENLVTIFVQLLSGLFLLIAGTKGFIHSISEISAIFNISALLLSLLIIPIATELPEKINSILWVRKGKDTLAFGNITGALVFQGTLLPAIGITLTPWIPEKDILAGVLITLLATIWLRLLINRGQLKIWHVLVNGALYLIYLMIVFNRHI
jgi:cation:H+ antiporter